MVIYLYTVCYPLGISVGFNGQQLGMSLDFTDFAPKKSDHFSGFMLSWALRLTPPWTKPAGEIHRS